MTQRQINADNQAFREHRLQCLEREIHFFRWARVRRFLTRWF